MADKPCLVCGGEVREKTVPTECGNTGTGVYACQQCGLLWDEEPVLIEAILPKPGSILWRLEHLGSCCERDYDGDGNCDRHPVKK